MAAGMAELKPNVDVADLDHTGVHFINMITMERTLVVL